MKSSRIFGNKNFLIGLDQIDGGPQLGLTLQQIIELYGSINPDAYRLKTVPIEEKDFSKELQEKINNFDPYDDKELRNRIANLETYKANKMDLHDYRRLDTEIHERDLSSEVQRKLNAISNGYDDSEVRNAITNLQTIKADKVQLENYRPKDILITRDDLDPEMLSFLENFDQLDAEIDVLRRTKADRTELIDYRHKLVAITKQDLDAELRAMLEAIPDGDHTDILLAIENLRENKADKTEVDSKATLEYVNETFRQLKDKIGLEDLDEALKNVLDDLPSNFDLGAFIDYVNQQLNRIDSEKLSVEASKVFRVKTEFITESDLDNALRDKVNAIGDGYDDEELRNAINELESRKLDSSTAAETYRKKAIAIAEEDLTPELQIKLNKDYDIEELRSRVTNVEENLDSKLEQSDLENYRTKDILIQEDDLSSEVRSKLNTITQGYDDKPLWNKVEELDAEDERLHAEDERLQSDIDEKHNLLSTLKADKAELSNYRLKTVEIVEGDLESSLQEKINKGASIDLSPLQTDIDNLQAEAERLENEKVDTQTLSNYRSKLDTIKKHDLDTTVIEYIDGKSYNDTTIKAELADKLDKVEAEETYRKKSEAIVKTDLNEVLQEKIDSITKDHTQMTNHNGDDNFIHITRTEYDKFLGYEAQLAGILDRLAKLESGIVRPQIVSSSIDDVEFVRVNVGKIEFTVTPTDTILENDTKIKMTPVDKITKKELVNGKLILTVSELDENTDYTIIVEEKALCFKDLHNDTPYVKEFRTEDVIIPPTIGRSNLYGQQNVPLSTTQIEFPISGEGTITIKDNSKIKMSPNKISGIPRITNSKLVLPLANLIEDTTYTVTIEAGALTSTTGADNVGNTIESFKTEDVLTKPIVGDSSLKDAIDVPVSTTRIVFPVTVEESLVIADQSKITVVPDVKNGNAAVEGNNLVVNIANLQGDTEYTVTIAAGAVRDGNDLTNDVNTVNSFLTKNVDTPETGSIVWEYETILDGISNDHILFKDIIDACGLDELDDTLFYSNSEEDFNADIISAEPPIVVEYIGTEAYPIPEGKRVPREGIDDGGECPEIPVPVHQPAGVNLYTMGACIPDVDRVNFQGGPVFAHKFRIRRYVR